MPCASSACTVFAICSSGASCVNSEFDIEVAIEIVFTFFRRMPRANGMSARGLMGELRALTPWSGQILQAVEGSQRDHIEVDQVQLRKGQGGDRLAGLFLAGAFKHQHHSAWFIRARIE